MTKQEAIALILQRVPQANEASAEAWLDDGIMQFEQDGEEVTEDNLPDVVEMTIGMMEEAQ